MRPLVWDDKKKESGFDASFSANGKRIVFITRTSITKGFNYDVFTMDSNGQEIKQITNNQSYNIRPVFSPDMKTILFLSDKERKKKFKLMQININGSNLNEIKIFQDE
jgi:Tol biopolymer transport system component